MAAALAAASASAPLGATGWSHYGATLAGDRYAAPSAITPKNAARLKLAWVYRTGDATDGRDFDGNRSRIRATPILIDGKLVVSTGFNRVYALDPATGQELWTFDPEVDFSRRYSEMFTSRGVSAWRRAASPRAHCDTRIFLGTLDARLIALDAATGKPCPEFGESGTVDLSEGIARYYKTDYSVTSPPTVVGDLVVVGAAVGDNGSVHTQPGTVRAYNVLDGALVWSWDPIPRAADHAGAATWPDAEGNQTGGANVWTVMSADETRDLVFLPTTSPSPDFYGGERLGDNAYANSVVALRASTGEFAWGFQTIRHDLWDYDIASQPLLFEHVSGGAPPRPALAQATKTGFVFVLDRETGEPLHSVEEREVPASDVPGERAARTQPFPKLRLHPTDIRPFEFWDFGDSHREGCERLFDDVRYDGIFTPPSLDGALLFPGNAGGTNWGSMAYDRAARLGYLVVNRIPTIVKLIPRSEFNAARRKGTLHGAEAEHTSQRGTPYGMARFDPFHNGLPCLAGPWSTLVAVDLDRGDVRWETPVGTTPWVDLGGEAESWGFPTNGGPLVTAGGVVFLATTSDATLRAFRGRDGREIWTHELPASAHATPMAYRHGDADYVVIATGGGLARGRGRGDHIVAFRLDAPTY